MPVIEREAVRDAVASATKQPPVRGDPQFACARRARVGSPALVHTPTGAPAFWLVPLLFEGLACGLAQVDLGGRVTRLGILGGSANDRASWIDPSFFETPPRDILAELEDSHAGATISEPVLSYDSSPTRWAWRLEIRTAGQLQAVAFVTPGGWYERPAEPRCLGWEA